MAAKWLKQQREKKTNSKRKIAKTKREIAKMYKSMQKIENFLLFLKQAFP